MTFMMSISFFLKHGGVWEESQEGEGEKDRSFLFLWGFTGLFKDYPEETRGQGASFDYSQAIKKASLDIRTAALKIKKTLRRFRTDAAFHNQVRKNH
jgi:hypothetical protein